MCKNISNRPPPYRFDFPLTLFVSNGIDALALGASVVGFFFTYSNLNVDDPILDDLVITVDVVVFVLIEPVIMFDCLPIVGMDFLNLGSLSNSFPASDNTNCRPLCNADVMRVLSVSSCIAMPCSFNSASVEAFTEFSSSVEWFVLIVVGWLAVMGNGVSVSVNELPSFAYIWLKMYRRQATVPDLIPATTNAAHPFRLCSTVRRCPQW